MIAGSLILTTFLSIPYQRLEIKEPPVSNIVVNEETIKGTYIKNIQLEDGVNYAIIKVEPVVDIHEETYEVVADVIPEIDMRVVPNGILTNRINEYRDTDVKESALLNELACTRAKFLFDNNQWSHDGWEDSFVQFKPKNRRHGENLGKRWYGDYSTLVDGWMTSRAHKACMTRSIYKYHGWCDYNEYVVSLFIE